MRDFILYSVSWNGSQWLAVGSNGTVLSSTDGITWTAQTSGTTNILKSVSWNGSQWLVVGTGGTILQSN